jgi:hypothetical protein
LLLLTYVATYSLYTFLIKGNLCALCMFHCCQHSGCESRYEKWSSKIFYSLIIVALFGIMSISTNLKPYTSAISKFTNCTNSSSLASISDFVISFKRSAPNFSTQKLAIAEPTIMAVFMFSKEISFVFAM